MWCPIYGVLEPADEMSLCGNLDDKVIESRQNISGTSIRRRRECASCSYRFTSYEKVEEVPLMVVKRDNTRQPFDLKNWRGVCSGQLKKDPCPN